MKRINPLTIGIAILAVAVVSGVAVKSMQPVKPSPFDLNRDITKVHRAIPSTASTQAYMLKLQQQHTSKHLSPEELAKVRAKNTPHHAVAPVGNDNV